MGDLVGADMVWVAVATVGAVGDHKVRLFGFEDGSKLLDGHVARIHKRPRVSARWRARHAGVAEAAGAAEELPARTDRVQGAPQLLDAETAELVRFVHHEVLIRLADDFAFLAEGAGDHQHVRAAGGKVCEGAGGGDCFVVGVGVHGDNAVAGKVSNGHGTS